MLLQSSINGKVENNSEEGDMKKTEITEKTETTDTIQDKELLSSTDLSSFASLTDLCRKVPTVQYLLEEWHTEYNSDPERSLSRTLNHSIILSPDQVLPTDTSIVWWKCSKGHAWQKSVVDRVTAALNGTDEGCIFCKPGKIERAKVLVDYCTGTVPEGEVDCSHLLTEWDYEKNYPLTPQDVKTVAYTKVWWKCENGHSWQQLISNRVKAGVGCPYCGHRKVLQGFNDLEYLYPDIAKEWDYEKNQKKPSEVTAMSGHRAWWICEHGHSYEKIISNRTQQGQGCPVCRALAGEKGSMLVLGVNDLVTTHPDIALEWNDERNGDLKPTDVKAGSRDVVWWKCRHGHEWQAPVARRTGKRKIGCPGCSGSSTYRKYEEMGCKKGFEHFHQGPDHAWRK